MRIVLMHPKAYDDLILHYLVLRLRDHCGDITVVCAEDGCEPQRIPLQGLGGIVICEGVWEKPLQQYLELVADSVERGRPLLVVGKGVRLLLLSGAASGLLVSCPPELAVELEGVGAAWTPGPVTVDGSVVTVSHADALERAVKEFLRLVKCWRALGSAREALWIAARASNI